MVGRTNPDKLTPAIKRKALWAINLIKENCCGKIKARTYAHGSSQHKCIPREEASSPTISLESLMALLMINTQEKKEMWWSLTSLTPTRRHRQQIHIIKDRRRISWHHVQHQSRVPPQRKIWEWQESAVHANSQGLIWHGVCPLWYKLYTDYYKRKVSTERVHVLQTKLSMESCAHRLFTLTTTCCPTWRPQRLT